MSSLLYDAFCHGRVPVLDPRLSVKAACYGQVTLGRQRAIRH